MSQMACYWGCSEQSWEQQHTEDDVVRGTVRDLLSVPSLGLLQHSPARGPKAVSQGGLSHMG